jgi:acyl transferase domain-containing protein
MEAVGLRLLDPEAVSAAFKGSGVSPQLGWARINADRFTKVNTVKGPWKFLDELSMAPVALKTPTVKEVGLPAASPSVAGVQAAEQQGPQLSLAAVEDSVRSVAIEILGEGVIDSTGQFPAGAFDSLSAVELSNKISELLEITLPGTLVFDYPSVPAIAAYVYSKMKPATSVTAASIAVLPSTTTMAVSCTRHGADGAALPLRVTIASKTPQHLASNSSTPTSVGFDSISIVPFGRWDLEAGSSAGSGGSKSARVRFASWLPDVASFDPVAFQLTGNEAEVMDPQQRLLLETSWEAIRAVTTINTNASIDTSNNFSTSALGIDTGVYVGIQQMEYGGLAAQHLPAMGAYSATSTPFSVAAGRLSFTYGFIGPAVSIDTACSSAMVAAHSAAQHLERRGGAALSAGINLMLAERTTAAAQIAGMLTVNGRCKTLDAAADGYVRAEACIVMVLQSPDSVEMGSSGFSSSSAAPFLMMRSTFVNQDGRSSSLTAPNGPAQQRVLRGALDAAHALPHDILGLEMHGTGTALGDPIEVGAATAVLPGQGGLLPLRFTAAKSRVGHAEPAAGSIGILQAAAQLMNNKTLAIMHLSRVNPYISSIYGELASQGQATPFAPKQDGPSVSTSSVFAPAGNSWLATMGTSSFAFQGTNAHVILSSSASVSSPQEEEEIQQRAATPWQHKRYWYAASPTSLLGTAKALNSRTSSFITFQTNLKKSALSFLYDHRVRGRAVFPAAAMLETTSAAAQAALETHTGELITIQGISISSPLLMQPTTALELVCKINANAGEVVLETGSVQHLGAVGALVRKQSGRAKPSLTLMQRMYAQFMQEAQHIINVAVPEVGQAARASAQPAVNATGELSTSALLTQGQQSGSFTTHPATFDAMTHVVSALQSQKESSGPEAVVTRVPAAIDAFLSAAAGDSTSMNSCSGAFEGILPDGTAVSSFRAFSEKAKATSTAIGGFHAKPVRASTGAAAAAITAVSAAARMLVSSRKHEAAPFVTKKSKKVDAKFTIATVQKLVNNMLNTEVAPNQPLMEAGMDSLGAVELRTALNKTFSVELPATVTFDFPSVSALAGYIKTELETVAEEEQEDEEEGEDHHVQAVPMGIPQHANVARSAAPFSDPAIQMQQQPEGLSAAQVGQKVSAAVNRLLGSQVAPDQPLMEAGMDSLGAVELRTTLNTTFNADFPATITFDYPTITALTTFIVANVEEFQLEVPAVATADSAQLSLATAATAIAVQHQHPIMRPLAASLPLVVAEPQATTTAVVGIGALYPSSQPYVASVSGLSAFEHGMRTSTDLPRPIPLEVKI